jgi:vancomycin resistance protein YoaR
MSAPVVVTAGDARTELSPAVVGAALRMQPTEAGRLEPVLDPAALQESAADALAEIGSEAKDATIRIEGGGPVVVPATTGQGVPPDQLATQVLAALTKAGEERVAPVELTVVEPELTTAEAEALGVREVVSEFTTRFPHADYRNVNLRRAAELIDNTLLEPGETFSLNRIVGERTAANGFEEGYVINSGRLVMELGGGVSQIATTTYNAGFFAGMEDVEHKPHSLYFSRYPMGREATVAWPSLDMAFKNNTPYGVVVDASFSASAPGRQGSVTVRLWSTPYWQVETSTSAPRNYREPKRVYDTSPDCEPQAGIRGFDVTVTRTLRREGAEPVTEEYVTNYKAGDEIICGAAP